MIAKIGTPLALLSMMCHLVTFAVIIDMHARIGPGGTMGAMHGPHRHLESSVADAVEAAVEQKNAELTATLHALTKVVEDLQETLQRHGLTTSDLEFEVTEGTTLVGQVSKENETLRQLHEARVPYYALADVTVDAEPDLSIELMAQRVIEALKTRNDVLERV